MTMHIKLTYYSIAFSLALLLQMSPGSAQPTPASPMPAAAAAGTIRSGNPVFPGWYADPEAAIFDHEYWIYPTYSAPYNQQVFFDAFSSPDLVHWTKHSRILDTNAVTWARRAMWAPAVAERNGKYYFFFGANDIHDENKEVGGIGVAVADRPEGPFRDLLGKPLVNQIRNGAQPIDQFVFRDQDGQDYLIYGGWSHCNIARLRPGFTGLEPFPDGTTFKEITPEHYVEGPMMFLKDAKYYLMWSEGGWTGPNYSVAYAIGDSPAGPFKRIGKVLQQDPAIATGAGHHSVFHVPGTDRWYIVYHRRPRGETDPNHRVTCIDEMHFDEHGFIKPIKITNEGVEPFPLGSNEPPTDEDAQAVRLITALLSGEGRDGIQKLLDEGLQINSRMKAGLSVYQAAVLRGETDLERFLASKGAITNAPIPPREPLAETLFRGMSTNNAPGLAVLVAQNGAVLFQHGYGLADVDQATPITAQTRFRIGSITKQFTASAILKLQEQGKLSVDDPLTRFFPGWPRGDEVHLRHLLTHTSGIHSYTDKPGFIEKVASPISAADLISSFRDDPYDFAPGKKWHYDNSGYFLLGAIVEKVSGQSYGEYLRDKFFRPLGMKDTAVHAGGARLDREALGYKFADGKFVKALNWDMSWAGGAGALDSTVEDLFRWNEAVFTGKVIGAASLKAAWTPVRTEEEPAENATTGYGFGWAMNQFRGVPEISHGGGLDGFSSFLMRLPSMNFTVVVLANALPGVPGRDPAQLAHLVTEIYLGDKLPARPIYEADPNIASQALDAIVGRYDYGNAVLTVSRQGGRVYAQLGLQPRFEIFPQTETNFFWKVTEAQVTFVKDASGKVVKAIHHQNGNTIVAPRLRDLKETTVALADTEAILGKYDYGQGQAIMTVSREGERVFAQLTGQPKLEIFATSPTDYFWKAVDAQVTFVKDSAGKVTKAVHHQDGRVLEAPKIQ